MQSKAAMYTANTMNAPWTAVKVVAANLILFLVVVQIVNLVVLYKAVTTHLTMYV